MSLVKCVCLCIREYKAYREQWEEERRQETQRNLVEAAVISGAMLVGLTREVGLLRAAHPNIQLTGPGSPTIDPATVTDPKLRKVRKDPFVPTATPTLRTATSSLATSAVLSRRSTDANKCHGGDCP